MKEIKELKFEELTLKQKLGLVHAAAASDGTPKEEIECLRELIREHAIGAVWIQWDNGGTDELLKMVKETADYPILIVTDAECGIGKYRIGHHNALGRCASEEHAYAFGKAVGVSARKMGYNTICSPVLDIKENGWSRAIGSDKNEIARIAAAEAKGLKDAGMLTIGKHYPSADDLEDVDTHMIEAQSAQSEEELLDKNLYPYLYLMNKGLLDGVMPAHHKLFNIDPDYPASLSKKVLDILRRQGFDGIMMTDALCMMGIRAKFGDVESRGLAIAAGNDLPLPYDGRIAFMKESLEKCYNDGIFTDEQLDIAVKRVLNAQHKVMMNSSCKSEISDDEDRLSKAINEDSVCALLDEGVNLEISRDGRHYFAVMIKNQSFNASKVADVDTFTREWLYPEMIKERILELFPNSEVTFYCEFPYQCHNYQIINNSLGFDDVIFLTFSECIAYMGAEHLTRRVVSLINSMQRTGRISTLIHFGNPKVVEELSHIERRIFAPASPLSTLAAIDVLAGLNSANGVLTYDVNLK